MPTKRSRVANASAHTLITSWRILAWHGSKSLFSYSTLFSLSTSNVGRFISTQARLGFPVQSVSLEPDMAKRADISVAKSNRKTHGCETISGRRRGRKRINEIRAQTQAVSGAREKYKILIADHEALTKRFEEETEVLRKTQDALNDANLGLAEFSVRERHFAMSTRSSLIGVSIDARR